MPTLRVSVSGAATASTVTSPSFTPQTGDIIVVKTVNEDSSNGSTSPTTAGSTFSAFTQQVLDTTASHTTAAIYTATCTAGGTSSTITTHISGAGSPHQSVTVEAWQNAKLAGTPATVDTRGSGAPSASITTAAANSVVSWLDGDWAAVTGSRTYGQSATEDGVDQQATFYCAAYAYQTAAAAGSQTLSMSAPTGQTFTVAGIEIQDVPAAGASLAQPGRTWLRRFHHRQAPPQFTASVAAAAVPVLVPPFPQHRPSGPAARARLGATVVAAGILATTTLSPQPSQVPPSRPGPTIGHPAPHRAAFRRAFTPPQLPQLAAKLPPTAISPRPPHRATGKGVLAKTTLSPQPSSVPPPLWRQPLAPRPPHRAAWRAIAGPAPAAVTVTAVPPARPTPDTNRPPPPHRAITRWVLATTTLSPQPSRVPPPQWRQPFAPRPPHRAIWRAVAGPAPAVIPATPTPPARPTPDTNRPPPPHRAIVRGVLAPPAPLVPPARPRPVTNRPPPPHRAVWDAIAGPAPAVIAATPAPPARPRPVTNRPPAPHRAITRAVLAKTTLSAQPTRVAGPQWRQPFAPRPAHRAIWRSITGAAPPPPPFTIGALTTFTAPATD